MEKLFLAVDGGGTKAEFVVFNKQGCVLKQFKIKGSNPNFGGMDKTKLVYENGINIALNSFPNIEFIYAGNAGLLLGNNKDILKKHLQNRYPHLQVECDTDLFNLLSLSPYKYLLILGTGVCLIEKNGNSFIKYEGRGRLIDRGGSAYHISKDAIESGVINSNFELTDSKIASLAPQIFDLYKKGNKLAEEILLRNAKEVANLIKLSNILKEDNKEIFVSGGLGEHFGNVYFPLIQKYVDVKFKTIDLPQIYGAAKRCISIFAQLSPKFENNFITSYKEAISMIAKTEQRNPKSKNLSKMTTMEMIQLMNEENLVAVKSLEPAFSSIVEAIEAVVKSFKNGGRLFYIGAGTSGRLGVLDASECPPTFGVDHSLVIGIIAGGFNSLIKASEDSEDSYQDGTKDVQKVNINKNDTIVGISANGNAQYVIGALEHANKVGATTISLSSNYDTKIGKVARIEIVTDTGPEVITGSTRLKAGTAQKLVLNMISTFAMVKTDKVFENLMINLKPSNIKLKDRMVRIVMEILGCDYHEATKKLDSHNWVIKDAIKNS